jgi:Prealbumin-like fold domain
MPSIHVRRHRFGRWWITAAMLTVLAFVAVVFVAASGANLAGSTFEGNDGNLVVNTAGNEDWDNAPNLHVGQDLPTGTGDNSFGQGTKEDDLTPTVVSGSIPNSKADLARFGVASEQVGNTHYLYLAWSRENKSGTVNFDFELNQKAQPGLTTPGQKTLNRTTGDVLLNYAFSGGSNSVIISKALWNGSAWGPLTALNANAFEGATNAAPVSENLGGNPAVNRPAQQFGEAAVNMEAAGLFTQGACESFASAYVKSRSSTAFTSEIKDFIAPVPVSIRNCGGIIIRKVTVPSPDPTSTSFGYTTTGGLSPSTFSLVDGGSQSYPNQAQGSYSVTENDPGPNFVNSAIDCSASSTSGGSTATPDLANRAIAINLKPGDLIDCTYTNTLQQGAIKVHKASIKGQALAGATFSIAGQSVTSDANGDACVDHLNFGSYNVQETAAPPGYSRDDTSVHSVQVNSAQTCASAVAPLDLQFNDTPLTDIHITSDSQAVGGTNSQITCVDSSNANIGDSPSGNVEHASVTAPGLSPGTYTCTVVVDP